MPPQAAEEPAVGVHAPAADLEVIVRRVLADVAAVEPLAVDEPTAAKMLACSYKTVAELPGDRVGRFYLGRAKRYRLEDLRRYIAELVQEQAKN